MNSYNINRKWKFEYGHGKKLIVILPRMDYTDVNIDEWTDLLNPFTEDASFLILDMPEKLTQENISNFTVKDLAYETNKYLTKNNIIPDMIWGFSLGGMIAQELSIYDSFVKTPLLLISTNLYANTKLKAIFSSWSLMVHKYGIPGFNLSLIPWISNSKNLPILNYDLLSPTTDDLIALNKIKSSLNAVSLHDARKITNSLKAPMKILFGEYSVLLGKSEANTFREYLPNSEIIFIKDSSMRILNDNKKSTIPLIKEYLSSN